MINVLEQASEIASRKWRGTSGVAKVFLGFFFFLSGVVLLACLTVWSVGKVLTSLTSGGVRNSELYIPTFRTKRRRL